MSPARTHGIIVTVASIALALSACAEGIEPPLPTSMVEVRSGLDFWFGPTGMCKGSDDLTCPTSGQTPVQWPTAEVALAPFAIDIDEVTNFQYEYCVAMKACSPPQFGNAADPSQFEYYGTERSRKFPVVNVTWGQANAYCEFVKKRLPSELEWERVAKGAGTPRAFAVDERWASPSACEGKLSAIGCGGDQRMEATGASQSDFVTEGGARIFHLTGNAAEWTDTWYDETITCAAPPPCDRIDACPSELGAERTRCEQNALECPACDRVTSGECYYMCEDSTSPSIVCVAYDAPVDASVLTPDQGADKVIRGGSVTVTRNQLCGLHAWSRQRNSLAFLSNAVGFRCARTLE